MKNILFFLFLLTNITLIAQDGTQVTDWEYKPVCYEDASGETTQLWAVSLNRVSLPKIQFPYVTVDAAGTMIEFATTAPYNLDTPPGVYTPGYCQETGTVQLDSASMNDFVNTLVEALPDSIPVYFLGPDSIYYSGPEEVDYNGPTTIDYAGPDSLYVAEFDSIYVSGPDSIYYSGPEEVDYNGPTTIDYAGPDSLYVAEFDSIYVSGPDSIYYSGPEEVDYNGPTTIDYAGPDSLFYVGPDSFYYSGPDTLIAVVDTLPPVTIDSLPPQFNESCYFDQFYEGGLDNTGTSFRHTNMVFTVEFDDASYNGSFSIASSTGWNDQTLKMGAGLSGIMPWAVTVETFCTSGCGGLPSPVLDLEKMFARYVGFRICPGDPVPTRVTYTSDQRPTERDLVMQYKTSKPVFLDRCTSCEIDGIEWTNAITGDPYDPVCPVPCSTPYAVVPETACTFTLIPACDSGNELSPGVFQEVLLQFADCGDGNIIDNSYIVDATGGFEDYVLLGAPQDCVSGVTVEAPIFISEVGDTSQLDCILDPICYDVASPEMRTNYMWSALPVTDPFAQCGIVVRMDVTGIWSDGVRLPLPYPFSGISGEINENATIALRNYLDCNCYNYESANSLSISCTDLQIDSVTIVTERTGANCPGGTELTPHTRLNTSDCPALKYDRWKQYFDCNQNFLYYQDPNGAFFQTLPSGVPALLVDCNQPDCVPQCSLAEPTEPEFNESCFYDIFQEGGIDNNGASLGHTNAVFSLEFDDPTLNGSFTIASTNNWNDVIDSMSLGIASIMPWAVSVSSFSTDGSGGFPTPSIELEEMIARYVGIRVCPGDPVPNRVTYMSDQRTVIDLRFQFKDTDRIFLDRCASCGTAGIEWTNALTGDPYDPVCPVPCSVPITEEPEPCFDLATGNQLCYYDYEEINVFAPVQFSTTPDPVTDEVNIFFTNSNQFYDIASCLPAEAEVTNTANGITYRLTLLSYDVNTDMFTYEWTIGNQSPPSNSIVATVDVQCASECRISVQYQDCETGAFYWSRQNDGTTISESELFVCNECVNEAPQEDIIVEAPEVTVEQNEVIFPPDTCLVEVCYQDVRSEYEIIEFYRVIDLCNGNSFVDYNETFTSTYTPQYDVRRCQPPKTVCDDDVEICSVSFGLLTDTSFTNNNYLVSVQISGIVYYPNTTLARTDTSAVIDFFEEITGCDWSADVGTNPLTNYSTAECDSHFDVINYAEYSDGTGLQTSNTPTWQCRSAPAREVLFTELCPPPIQKNAQAGERQEFPPNTIPTQVSFTIPKNARSMIIYNVTATDIEVFINLTKIYIPRYGTYIQNWEQDRDLSLVSPDGIAIVNFLSDVGGTTGTNNPAVIFNYRMY